MRKEEMRAQPGALDPTIEYLIPYVSNFGTDRRAKLITCSVMGRRMAGKSQVRNFQCSTPSSKCY
jgi:hypothetical protein